MMTAFVFIDYIFSLGLIQRVPTWVRFSKGEATMETASEAIGVSEAKEVEAEPVEECDDPFFCF